MNWFKLSQQQLLFYPWTSLDGPNRSPVMYHNRSSIYPSISNIDKDGVRYFKCDVCKRDVTEENIYEFVDSRYGYNEKYDKFAYPFKYIDWKNTDKLKSELVKLHSEIVPAYTQFSLLKEQRKSFNFTKENEEIDNKIKQIDTSGILKVFNSSPELIEVAQMISNIYPYSHSLYFLPALLNGELNFNLLSYFMENMNSIIGDIIAEVEKTGYSFTVPTKKVICKECAENSKKCVQCDEPILSEEDSYPVTWNDEDRVCRKCIDSGYFDVCSECGKADDVDSMHFLEYLEATFCEYCVKDKYKDYSYYENDIEEISQQNPKPFKSWFGDGDRIYLPFISDYEKLGEVDEKITKYLQQNGCDTNSIDYQDGYCSYKGRRFRIGKFLEKIKYENEKKIKNTFKNNPGLQRANLNRINNFFNDILNNFSQSPYRKLKKQDDKIIVISQNPHDIAKMSTGRRWPSCMNLDKGGDRIDDVFCEVKEGGIIAYLVDKDDKDIEDPYARVLIRRFSNKNGVSLAVPEERVYGSAPKSFLMQVKDWLESKQKLLEKGKYNLEGMDWSDTFDARVYDKVSMMIAEQIIKIESEIKLMKKSGWYNRIKEADRKSEVKLFGTLEQSPDGFTYLKLSNNIINGFFMSIKDEDVEKPPYNTKAMNNTGAHATVFYADEVKENKLDIKEVGKEIGFKVGKMYSVNPEGWKEMDRVWFLEIYSTELENLRKKYGLSKLVNGHQYHITVGVKKKK